MSMVKYILCLSGGGIKGCIISSFLQELEKKLEKKGSSIYNKFDMFAGTSTGSLIVGALAYEKISGEKLNNELYNFSNSQKIMDKSQWDKMFGTMQHNPKYTNEGLQEVIDNLLTSEKTIKDTQKQVLITAFDVEKYKPVVFKSFKHDISLKSAMCMSSAAPAYFPTFHDKKTGRWAIDGGVFAQSPTDCAYAEALKFYGKEEDIRILSIGTGYKKTEFNGEKSQYYGGLEWLTKGNLIDILFSGPQQAVDYRMGVFTQALGHKYLHVDGIIENSTMDDVTPENITQLKEHGKSWFEEYKNQLDEFFLD